MTSSCILLSKIFYFFWVCDYISIFETFGANSKWNFGLQFHFLVAGGFWENKFEVWSIWKFSWGMLYRVFIIWNWRASALRATNVSKELELNGPALLLNNWGLSLVNSFCRQFYSRNLVLARQGVGKRLNGKLICATDIAYSYSSLTWH